MITSAGILFVYDHKALLMHPTNGKDDLYMPPKGQVDGIETILQAAIREVMEETGIDVYVDDLIEDDIQIIEYRNKNGKNHKTVHIIIHYIKELSEIGLTTLEVPKTQLQLEENDCGKFMSAEEVEKHCMWRYKEFVLNAIK